MRMRYHFGVAQIFSRFNYRKSQSLSPTRKATD